MKRVLLIFGILIMSLGAFAQSGQDFPSFGNDYLTPKNIVEIYPNPSVDFLNVQIKESELIETELVVYNIIGNKFELEIEETGNQQYQIDVRDLPPGYYLLSIKDKPAEFSKTYKFLKR